MKRNPKVSIVVPCFNSRGLIDSCLKSFLATKYQNFEIIIIDDASFDGTYEYLKEKYARNKKIRTIRNKENKGPSYTRNQGIKNAEGKYIAFLEMDMRVDPRWLGFLVKRIEEDKSLGAVQSKVLDLKKKDLIQAVGVHYDPHTFWVVSLGCGLNDKLVNKPMEVGVGAVGSMFRKSVLDTIGGFDERLVHNVDDIDLGWRAWIAGYKIETVPESITYHWTAKPLKTREKITPSFRSEFYFHKTPRIFLKNYEWKNVLRYMPWLIFIFGIRSFKNLFEGNSRPLVGFIKAIFWNIWVLPDTMNERKRIQRLRKVPDNYIFDKIALKGNFFKIYFENINPLLERSVRAFTS